MAQIGEIHARRVEIVPYRDTVQVVERATGVDDGARTRIEQDRLRERVGEWHANGGRARARGILLVDLLYGEQEVLTALLNGGRRAVGEPDLVTRDAVTRHLAGVHDVVEDDEPSLVILAGLCQKAEVGVQRIGGREVPDRAVPIDLELGGSRVAGESVDHAARVIGAVLRLRGKRRAQQQHEGEQQEPDSAAARSHSSLIRSDHASPRSNRTARSHHRDWTEAPEERAGFRRSRCRRVSRPFRPVTLRRHLSVALPLSESS